MTTLRVYRSELVAPAPRLRVYRSELVATAASRLRVYRSELVSTPATASALRVYRSELAVLPGVTIPVTFTVKPFETLLMQGAVPGASAWQWEQTSGATVTTNGSGSWRTFVAPASTAQQTLTFRLRALVSGSWTGWTTVTATVERHRYWTLRSGVLQPIHRPVSTTPPEPNPDPPAETPTDGLFFQLPGNIRSYAKKSFPHYFTPYPRNRDNTAFTRPNGRPGNVIDSAYLTPTGDSNRHVAYGGLVRDRLFHAPVGASSTYRRENAKTEIEWAMQGGHDGFFMDLLGVTGVNWDYCLATRDAAIQYYPGFYIVPMVDGTGGHSTASTSQVVSNLMQFANRASSYYLPDGRFVVASFRMESLPPAWWQAIVDGMPIPTVLVGVYNNYGNSAPYASMVWASSVWGYGADPLAIQSTANYAATARSRGHKWMAPVVPQNTRPNQSWYEEALGTASLRASWVRAIGENADLVQPITWNDFSEGGQVGVTIKNGYALNDLNAYYITWWKTGTKPNILRDAIYLSHRNQLLNATPVHPSTTPMTQNTSRPQESTPANVVEAVVFATAAATLTVTVAGTPHTFSVEPGENVFTAPLAAGSISAALVRSSVTVASITSPIAVVSNPPVQDLEYYRFSSLRPTDTYFVPSYIP